MIEILEMMREGTVSTIWIPVILYALGSLAINYTMAKTKGYRIIPAIVCGIIPAVNVVSALIYIGLPKKDK